MDEKLLEAHLTPLRQQLERIETMLRDAQKNEVRNREDIAALKAEVAHLRRVIHAAVAAVGALVIQAVIFWVNAPPVG